MRNRLLWTRRACLQLACAVVALSACNALTPAPTPAVLADSVFSGYAFVDLNGNGQVDRTDPPLKDAVFTVDIQGAQFGARTDTKGNAFVLVPGSVKYPVVLTMQPPSNGLYVLVGPTNIVWNGPGGKADFLFRSK